MQVWPHVLVLNTELETGAYMTPESQPMASEEDSEVVAKPMRKQRDNS